MKKSILQPNAEYSLKYGISILFVMLSFFVASDGLSQSQADINPDKFDVGKDLLIADYDCKTDVDDLHSVAAFATILAHPDYSDINYHAVAGTYGIQEGLYVPPNELFELAFGDNWSDAHTDFDQALREVSAIVSETISKGGDVWVAEGGQSDFTAAVVKEAMANHPDSNIKDRIHVVQHSDWNEEVTAPDKLAFVKSSTSYHRIKDGNAVGNGTPGFRSKKKINWKSSIADSHLTEVWELAIELGNRYNGKEGRYLNEAVEAGGLDFSDTSEICWILGINDLKDSDSFFSALGE